MTRKHFAMRNFFRDAPAKLLGRYFEKNGWLKNFDFAAYQPGEAELLYQKWETLPDDVRAQSEEAFREIHAMACDGGIKAVLEDAEFWQKKDEVLESLSKLKGWHEKSFTAYLDHSQYWNVATSFFHADNIGAKYWRKRKNLPTIPAKVDDNSVAILQESLVRFFTSKEGRGGRCKIEVYRRGELEYFFAYPEDHPHKPLVWKGKELRPQLETPAFEIIFIFDKNQGTLDLYVDGNRRLVPELQKIFSGAVLDFVLTEDEKDQRIYDLNPLLKPDVPFQFEPESGILSVAVKSLRIKLDGSIQRRIMLEASPSEFNPRAVYDLLDQVEKAFPKNSMFVTQVGLVVTMAGKNGGKSTTRSFNIGWPNSCSLAHDEKGENIRAMLVASGLEPRLPG